MINSGFAENAKKVDVLSIVIHLDSTVRGKKLVISLIVTGRALGHLLQSTINLTIAKYYHDKMVLKKE